VNFFTSKDSSEEQHEKVWLSSLLEISMGGLQSI